MLPNACPKPKSKPKVRVSLKHGKPLPRTKMRNGAGSKRRGRSSFPKRRDYGYLKWVVEESPCLLSYHWREDTDEPHICLGPIQACHVKSRGAGGADRGNVVAMCAGAHDEQHHVGIRSFQKRWSVDMETAAHELLGEYLVGAAPSPDPRLNQENQT